jgi:hypothetical protein
LPQQRDDARLFYFVQMFMQQSREFMQGYEFFCFVVRQVNEQRRVFRRKSEMCLDEIQNAIQFAFFEDVIGARNFEHQHGRRHVQRGGTIFGICRSGFR